MPQNNTVYTLQNDIPCLSGTCFAIVNMEGITIDGNGYTIIGGGDCLAVNVTSSSAITITNLQFANGSHLEFINGVPIPTSTHHISNCVFRDPSSTSYVQLVDQNKPTYYLTNNTIYSSFQNAMLLIYATNLYLHDTTVYGSPGPVQGSNFVFYISAVDNFEMIRTDYYNISTMPLNNYATYSTVINSTVHSGQLYQMGSTFFLYNIGGTVTNTVIQNVEVRCFS